MKKIFSFIVIALSIAMFSSCEKDAGKLPNISLSTASGYTGADATVAKSTAIKFGIIASKAENRDVLKTFDGSVSMDGGTATSFTSEAMTSANEDNYTKDVSITTRAVAGTEKYTFTVVNKDGLKNSVTVTLTVN